MESVLIRVLSIIYRTFNGLTDQIWFESKIICDIKFTLKTGLLLYIFNVYMPCYQYNFINIYIEAFFRFPIIV